MRCCKLPDVPQLCIAQDDAADDLLSRDPLALLLGMLLDQNMRQRSSGLCLLRLLPDALRPPRRWRCVVAGS
jgi:hypothetical protein